MASLKLTGINKIYPSGESALYDVTLEAEDKEFLVIIGGEKCGKSTLLRIIAGLEEATSGVVEIDGKDVGDVEPKDRDVAMVFKGNTLYPALNVYDNLAFGLRLRKTSQAVVDKCVKAVANILGLNDLLYRKPKVLSAADKQRVAIGRAIVREPRLYLFDDPISGLDEKLKADMLELIINLQARMQGTFVYATKNLAEAMTIGTRAVVLKNGLVQQIDLPVNLYDYPANEYVAYIAGMPRINFLRNAKIIKEDGYFAVLGGLKLKLSENIVSRFKNIDEYAGTDRAVTLGLRPEDIECKRVGGEVEAVAARQEESGGITYIECDLSGGISMICRGQSDITKGDSVTLDIDLTRLYIFDKETTLTVLERDGGYKKTAFKDADFKPMPIDEERQVTESLKPKKDKKKK